MLRQDSATDPFAIESSGEEIDVNKKSETERGKEDAR
jgi:hypothetical protein